MTQTRQEQEAEVLRLEAEAARLETQQVAAARTDLGAFLEFTLRDEQSGSRIRLADIHYSWIRHITVCWAQGLIPWIMAPFGAGKTSFVVGLSLFCLGIDRNLRGRIISANDQLAKDRVTLLRQYIQYSDPYHQVFPLVQPSETNAWTTRTLFVTRDTMAKDPTFQACGATSSITGARVDLLILDDICDLRNMILYPKLRSTVWQKYLEAIARVEEHGRVASIATRWHQDDVYGRITRDVDMAQNYGFLIQSAADDFSGIDCEVILGHGRRNRRREHVPRTKLEDLIQLWDQGYLQQEAR
jgi:hypothetical protein